MEVVNIQCHVFFDGSDHVRSPMMACSWRYRLHEQRCQRSPGQVKACAGAARLAGVIVREGGRLNQPFVAIMSDREREFRGGGAPADLWLAHRPLAQVGGTQNANQTCKV